LDDANLGDELTDSLNRPTRSLKVAPIVIVIGSAVASALNAMLKPTTRTVVAVSGWTKNNKGLAISAAKVAAGPMAAGSIIVTVGEGGYCLSQD
jgi:C4-dicarboxylate transporter